MPGPVEQHRETADHDGWSGGAAWWSHRADVIGRAMRLIADGVADRDGVAGLTARLGCTERELGQLLRAEVGAGPLAFVRAHRARTARVLIENTDLALAHIAFAAGFGNPQQLTAAVREMFGRTPAALRGAHRHDSTVTALGSGLTSVTLRLAYREPLHAGALMGFLAARTIDGVDEVVGGAYRRGMLLPRGPGLAEISLSTGYALATLHVTDVRDLVPAIARCRRLLDLDADPITIDGALAGDPALAPSVANEPGVRVPGAVDGFEMAVRAIVGQQISVAGARTILARLVHHCTLPTPPISADLLSADHDPGVMIGAKKRPPAHDHGDLGARGGRARVSGAGTDGARASGAGARWARADGVGAGADAAGASAAGARWARADGVGAGVGAARAGGELRGFPTPEQVAAAPDEAFGMPAARRLTLRTLAEMIADGGLHLDPGADRTETEARLLAIRGIGPWTAQYVAARALADPDVLLPTDLGVRRGAAALGLSDDPAALAAHARDHWAPWRSYATIRLWRHA